MANTINKKILVILALAMATTLIFSFIFTSIYTDWKIAQYDQILIKCLN